MTDTGWEVYDYIITGAYYEDERLVLEISEADNPTGWIARDYAENFGLTVDELKHWDAVARARA